MELNSDTIAFELPLNYYSQYSLKM